MLARRLAFPIALPHCLQLFLCCVWVMPSGCKSRESSKGELKVNRSHPNSPALDVNDLSYMFVKNKTGQIYPFIPVGRSWSTILKQAGLRLDSASTLPIMTSDVYERVVLATENQANFTPQGIGSGFKGISTPFKSTNEKRFENFEYDNLVVTSFRIDPCAPSLAFDANRTTYQSPSKYWTNDGQGYAKNAVNAINSEINRLKLGFQLGACQTQIRLIIQPADASFKTIGESTIHMVFTLNTPGSSPYDQPNGIMHPILSQAVVDLKQDLEDVTTIDTTGLMLQEHPGLKFEALRNSDNTSPGKGAKVILKFLQKYLGLYQNSQVMAIIRETQRDVPAEGGKTTTEIVDVVLGGGTGAGRYQPNSLVSSSLVNGFIMTSSEKRGAWKIVPAPEFNHSINVGDFNNAGLDNATDPEGVVLSKLMNADNPETTHFFANDCITCHGTSQLLREMSDKVTAQANSKRYQVPAGVSGFPIGSYLPPSAKDAKGVILRNFGYARNHPVIGLRTVTETAALVDYFNRDLLGLQNPGADCLTPQNGKLEQEIWGRTMSIDQPSKYNDIGTYTVDLERLRMNRMAPEDKFFSKCDTINQTAIGNRAGTPIARPTPGTRNSVIDDLDEDEARSYESQHLADARKDLAAAEAINKILVALRISELNSKSNEVMSHLKGVKNHWQSAQKGQFTSNEQLSLVRKIDESVSVLDRKIAQIRSLVGSNEGNSGEVVKDLVDSIDEATTLAENIVSFWTSLAGE